MSGLELHIKCHGDDELRKFYEDLIVRLEEDVKSGKILDSGIDLMCPKDTFITSNSTKLYDLEVSCALYRRVAGELIPMPYYLYPRSSISKTPLRLANSVGIIDAGYRGHLMAALDCIYLNPYTSWRVDEKGRMVDRCIPTDPKHSPPPRGKIIKGSRLVQICSPDLTPITTVKIVSDLDTTARGSGGFGSTGM